MDVTDLVRRLVRRRWAVVLVIVLAVGAAAAGAVTAGSSQQSTATVLIVPPPLGDAVSDRNPLLNLDNNLAQLATVLAASLNSSEATADLVERGAGGSFTVSTITGTNPSFAQLSPQLVFTVTAPDSPTARRTARALVAETRDQLADLQAQASVPAAARASIVEVVAPTVPEAAGNGRLRTAGSFGLAVVVLGLLIVLLVDEVLNRRRGAPAAEPSAAAAPASEPRAEVPAKAAAEAPAKAAAKAAAKAPAKAPAKVGTTKRTPPAKAGAGKAGRSNGRSTRSRRSR